MIDLIYELVFAALIIAAVIAYFVNRRKKLARMGLRDQIEDMFSNYEDK